MLIRGVVSSPVRGVVDAPLKGGGPDAYSPFPPPAGFRWDFVTYEGVTVTYGGEPVVALIGA